MDFSTETLESLGREAKARIDQGDKAKDRAEQMYISAGLYLKEAKARVEKRKDITWVQYLIKHCPVGKSRSYELIAIADGRKTVEEVRTEKNKTSQETRQRQRGTSTASGQTSSKTEQKQSPQPQAARTTVDEARDEADDHHDAMLKRVIAMVKKLDANQLNALELKLKEITQ